MSKSFFSPAEFESRHDKVRVAMDDAGVDLLIVVAPVHINYLIGTPAKGYQEFQALFFPREPEPLTVLTRLCEVPLFQAESLAGDIRGWGGREPGDPIAAFRQVMVEKGYLSRRVGLEVPAYYLHPHDYRKLEAVLGESLVMDATDLIGSVKLVKSAAEIDCVRKSAAILDAAMETCRGSIAEGRTEREVSADVHHTLMVSGSDIPSSPMNFLTGPRTGSPRTAYCGPATSCTSSSAPTTGATAAGNSVSANPPRGCARCTRWRAMPAMPAWRRSGRACPRPCRCLFGVPAPALADEPMAGNRGEAVPRHPARTAA